LIPEGDIKFGLSLDDFYSKSSTFSPQRSDEIFDAIRKSDLGAEFLVAYTGDHEPVIIRIEQNGDVWPEAGHYTAIGSAEPLARAIFSQIDQDGFRPLLECLTWVWQSKLTAENNPHVGDKFVIWVLLPGGKEFLLSDEAWGILSETPGITLAPIDPRLTALKAKLFKKHQDG
jgi:hypothetical protein